jgi:hypothetical protein
VRLNLFWLKYLSYACAAGAFGFYSAVRFKKLPGITPAVKLMAFVACIVVACEAWHMQETNADQHSPRQLVVGTVTSVNVSTHKSGSIEDSFRLKLDSGSLSPEFSTDTVAPDRSQQPIHTGDVLGVLYRTWDGVPLTIDELQGQRPGWHYSRHRFLNPYVWTVGIVGFFMFIGLLILTVKRNAGKPAPDTVTSLSA